MSVQLCSVMGIICHRPLAVTVIQMHYVSVVFQGLDPSNVESIFFFLQGGLSTRDEMCLSYLLYYPRVNLARCESLPEITGQLRFIGVKEIQEPVT